MFHKLVPSLLALALTGAAIGALPKAAFAQTATAVQDNVTTNTLPMRILTPVQAQADVALMRRALETIHPGLYRRTSKAQLDRAFSALERATRQPISDAELYRQISLVLADIRCNHTKAEQPSSIETWRTNNPSHLPFRFTLAQGRMIVVSTDPAQTGLEVGDEIRTINGRSIATLTRTLGAYVPIDGQTTWTRATKLANDSDLMGSDFDHFYPYVFGFEQSYRMSISSRDTDTVRTVVQTPIAFDLWQTLPNGGAKYRLNFSEATSWRLFDKDTALLNIGTFVNYRIPVDASQFYAAIFAQIKASGAKRLIIDLRLNGGGSSDATIALADALLTRPYIWNRAIAYKAVRYGDLPNFIETWGDRNATFNPQLANFTQTPLGYEEIPALSPDELLPRTPSPNGFVGPVTILTGPANASGATMLIAKLRDEGRVTLVGGRTGGSGDGPTSGRVFNVKLPNSQIAIRIPNAFNAMQVSRFEAKGGVTPDLVVDPSVADVRAGRDRVLEVALAQPIREMNTPQTPVIAPDMKPVMTRFIGNWTGTLTYRDYQSNGRVTLPTKMAITPEGGGQQAKIAFTYDDGPNKTVYGGFVLNLNPVQQILSKQESGKAPDLFRAYGNMSPANGEPLNLVSWGRSTENDRAVDVRETLTVTATTYRLLRETRLTGEGAFQFRHEYNFNRE